MKTSIKIRGFTTCPVVHASCDPRHCVLFFLPVFYSISASTAGSWSESLANGIASGAQMIDVFDHDYAHLNRHAKQCQESNSNRYAEVRASQHQRNDSPDRRHGNVRQGQRRPLGRVEHGKQNDVNNQDGNRQHNQKSSLRTLLALILLPALGDIFRASSPASLPWPFVLFTVLPRSRPRTLSLFAIYREFDL